MSDAAKPLPRQVEKALATLTLFMGTYPLVLLLGRAGSGGNLTTQLMWLVLYGIGIALALSQLNFFVFVLTRDKLLLVLVAWVLLSVLWSVEPALSLRRGIALALTTLYGAYLATRFTLRDLLVMVAWVLGIAAVLSFIAIVLPPHVGLEPGPANAGAWKGIFFQKNTLGSYTALGMVVFYLIGRNKRGQRGVWLMFGLMVLLTAFSRSGTGLVVVTLTLAALFAFRYLRYHWHPMFIPVALMSAVVFVILAVAVFYATAAVPFLRLVGKDLTFSGRIPAWTLMWDMVTLKPWLGYGYSGFWNGWESPGGWYVWNRLNWQPLHGHNGFMDTLVTVGAVGLALLLLNYGKNLWLAVKWVRVDGSPLRLWPLAFLTFYALYSLVESALLEQNTFLWMVYAALSFALSLWRAESRQGAIIVPTAGTDDSESAQHVAAPT
ncbi:MAG: O-antigen ligase family protein [Anaerolineae bacterium]|nr:O-antigen ligase family protein [Anaerolineae bacterium]MCO5187234.1 O-antigen ligase family protein [Anaerolineae bacterium]